MIFSIGYRDKSYTATNFRKRDTKQLKKYIVKCFTIDDKCLRQFGGGGYRKELFNRIHDIHSAEKVLYRQIFDLYTPYVNYNLKGFETVKVFKIVQNKLLYATYHLRVLTKLMRIFQLINNLTITNY